MKFPDWSRRPPSPRGIHFGEAAARWAEPRFNAELRPVAAYVADVLCEHVGLTFAELEPQSVLITDLRIDEETPEFIMALEEDLGFAISDADCLTLNTISELVSYLYARLQSASGRRT